VDVHPPREKRVSLAKNEERRKESTLEGVRSSFHTSYEVTGKGPTTVLKAESELSVDDRR
jgi:hypothetical protein